jgi:DNA-directed RNA polymerase II subunit RPB1
MQNNDIINTIERIEFCVFGNDEIKRYSAVSKDLYGIILPETDENGKPKKGGLNDPRLGVTDYIPCATCGLDMTYCQGHPGHVELPEPVFHIGFKLFIKNILSSICINCSKLLVYKTEDEIDFILKNYSRKKRFVEIKKTISKVKACQKPDVGCGRPVPKISIEINKKTADIQFVAETEFVGEEEQPVEEKGQKVKEYLSAERIFDIFKNINDVDAKILGFDPKYCRPEDLIIKNFIIPPVAIRPSAKLEALGSSYEDMMTHKLVDIIKNANARRKQREKKLSGGEGKYDRDNQHLLQYHIATYFDNDSITLPKSEQKTGNRASKSVSERLKGKHGRVRGNLQGNDNQRLYL